MPDDEWEAERQRRAQKAQAELHRLMAEAQRHRAHAPRYERQLNMPYSSARTHERGKPWRADQMCSAQWQQLQEIRADDRARSARKRRHDRDVEVELQTLTTAPVTSREKVAA